MSSQTTVTFKTVQGVPLEFDIYHPRHASGSVPAIIYFHGGGLINGNRHMLPVWLATRAEAAGFAFITADYRLLPSAGTTGHQILEDVKDVFAFVASAIFQHPSTETQYRVDSNAMFSAGNSSGVLCAYLAAHASPKPKAILSVYGMGGDLFLPFYTNPKGAGEFGGGTDLAPGGKQNPLDPKFSDLLYPNCLTTAPVVNVPIFSGSRHLDLLSLFHEGALYLQYYTGKHDDRILSPSDVPAEQQHLFPQLSVTADWPPTFFIHGDSDTMVLEKESRNMHTLLKDNGVTTRYFVLKGLSHGFDFRPGSEQEYGDLFDKAFQFLKDNV